MTFITECTLNLFHLNDDFKYIVFFLNVNNSIVSYEKFDSKKKVLGTLDIEFSRSHMKLIELQPIKNFTLMLFKITVDRDNIFFFEIRPFRVEMNIKV